MVASALVHTQLFTVDDQPLCLPHHSVPEGRGVRHLERAPASVQYLDIQPTSQRAGKRKYPCDIQSEAH